jgi:uncharacterized protein (TIGR03067 family)
MSYIVDRVFLSLCGLLTIRLTVTADDSESPKAKPDAKPLRGSWSLTAYTLDGREAPADLLKKVEVTFQDGGFTLKPMPVYSTDYETGKSTWELKMEFQAKFELGTSGKLQTIDLITGEGKDASRLKGIYKLKDDSLQLCFSFKDAPPTAFESKRGSENRLLHLKRVKR